MGAMIMVESYILALMAGAALHQGLSETPTWVGSMEVRACLSDSVVLATWLIRQAAPGQAQPLAFTHVGLGPLIDMDNRRRDDEDRQRRREEKARQEAQRDEGLRTHYRNYGYTSPPFIYADPRLGPYSPDLRTGHYYNYGTRYYYDPDTGQHYDINKNKNNSSRPVFR
jgi:hypothetical protein